jgi:hypothetical protein
MAKPKAVFDPVFVSLGSKPEITAAQHFCPLHINKQTPAGRVQCDAKCHNRTHAVQQKLFGYSMISSASSWIEFGTSTPSALAVLRLITNSNFVGA